jgi:antitoxin CcdA
LTIGDGLIILPEYTCVLEGVMRAKLSLTIESGVVAEARALGVNMSRVAEQAIADANKAARNRAWVAANRAKLDAYARQIAEEGCALTRFRRF